MVYSIFFLRILSSFFLLSIFIFIYLFNESLLKYLFFVIYLLIFYEVYKNFIVNSKAIFFIYLYILFSFTLSQGDVSAVFLLISPSTTMNGLGESGVSPTTNDIYSVYYNPAQINLPSGVSFQYSSMKEHWLPGLADDIFIKNKLRMIGYKGPLTDKILFQIAISELNTVLDLGEQQGTDQFGNPTGTFKSYMTFILWSVLSPKHN